MPKIQFHSHSVFRKVKKAFYFYTTRAHLLFRHRMNQHRDLKNGVVRFVSAADCQILCPSSLSTSILVQKSYWILEYGLQQIQNCHVSWKGHLLRCKLTFGMTYIGLFGLN